MHAAAFLVACVSWASGAQEQLAAGVQLPCILSPWSGWSPCTKSCTTTTTVEVDGTKQHVPASCACYRYKSRAVLQEPTGRAAPCGAQAQKRWCPPKSERGQQCKARYAGMNVQWSFPTCGTPPEVEYARKIRGTGEQDGDFVQYNCGEGFRLHGAARMRCRCGSDDESCAWEPPPSCVHSTSEILAGNEGILADHVDHRATCTCDPFRASSELASDVRCEMDTKLCDAAKSNPQTSISQVQRACSATHRSIRVIHKLKPKIHKKHHRCAYSEALSACKCCDCERLAVASNGCPCGAAEILFQKRWRMGDTEFWWSFRPVAGTKTCQVKGEMKRLGWNRKTAPLVSDAYVLGRLSIRKHRLFFEGDWTQPADPRCQDIGTDVDDALVWNLLAAVPFNGADCGSMRFYVSGATGLKGFWHLKAGGPRQSSITAGGFDTASQSWAPRFLSAPCDAANPCSPAHVNSLQLATLDTTAEAVCHKG